CIKLRCIELITPYIGDSYLYILIVIGEFMSLVVLDLKVLNKKEVVGKLKMYGIELPNAFDFSQHISITLCTCCRRIIEVEKIA
ncbi:hypothetical protein, partial [Vibrio cyclitrophicus]|uniref:hypothetical protein n=1 Tax=Vibrio cyclitrophicus TaxID=47951 RepID=UPI000CC20B2D